MKTTLGSWQKNGSLHARRDDKDRAGAIVFAPGSADGGLWGWFAINERSESLPPVGTPKAPSEQEAKRLADGAARSLGMTVAA